MVLGCAPALSCLPLSPEKSFIAGSSAGVKMKAAAMCVLNTQNALLMPIHSAGEMHRQSKVHGLVCAYVCRWVDGGWATLIHIQISIRGVHPPKNSLERTLLCIRV